MVDIRHEEYRRLIEEIEELEEKLENSADNDSRKSIQELLTQKQDELARISKGCR